MCRAALVAVSLAVWFPACQGPTASAVGAALPAVGAGLLQADGEVPVGARTWVRPDWVVGERFVLQRGERVRGEFTVEAVADDHYALTAGGPLQLRRDRDLGNLGEWLDGEPVHELAPVDVRYHWPLWVGKRWRCEFVDRAANGPTLRLQASYVVEALETIEVPAGRFEALRILRCLRLVDGGDDYLTRTQVCWYAPELGTELRQVVADTMVELVEHSRPQ